MLIPRELNFFDTNPLSFVLEQKLIWDRFPYKSLCIEVLQAHHDRTEAIVVIAIAIRTIEGKQTCIGSIPIVATTFRERIVKRRKVRVVQFNPTIFFGAKAPFYFNSYFIPVFIPSLPL